ncbi:MAG: hypothetical protein OEX22_02525 [Cyclobacteriaceae bacterium]|nr:hypothetical protein [Cyclobacteriaceae bacterium]
MDFSNFLGLFKEGKVGAKSHMKNLIEMAMVDGHFDDTESDLLKQIAKRHKISEKQLDQIQNNMEEVHFEVPTDEKIKFSQLFDLVNMMVIDKYIDSEEMKLCSIFAKKFGYKESNVDELVNAIAENIKNGQVLNDTKTRVNWLLN